MKPISFLLLFSYLFINTSVLSGQYIKGKLVDQETGIPLANTEVKINEAPFISDHYGKFKVNNTFTTPELDIEVSPAGYAPFTMTAINTPNETIELGMLFMEGDIISSKVSDFGLIEGDDLEIFDVDQDVSSLLSASWDPFGSLADFNFRITRFNPRGLDQDHSKIFLNGLPFNNLENGRFFWSLWGGLNDVMRNKYAQYGMNSTDYTAGGLSGSTDIDLRATNQRKQTKLVADYSNRSYRYRTMLTHSSGVQQNGWAYSLSFSRRWGDEGYIKGTYYDGYSYYASVDKVMENHSFSISAFAAPTVRGRSTSSTQFMYDLVGDNFYNPNWGFQNGEVRNSREYRTHQPVFTFRHDYKISDNTFLTTSLGYQTGRFGSTRMGWIDAADPRPDYYGNLPYDNRGNLSENDLQALTEKYQDPSVSQLDWDELYEINRNRLYTITDPNDPSITSEENISAYVIEEQHYDNSKMILHSNIRHSINEKLRMAGGIMLQYDKNHNYKLLDDLLGGTYFIDIDGFALRDSADNVFIQNDIERPNRLLKEGDVFGYDYTIHNQAASIWSNWNLAMSKIDFSLNLSANYNSFWREGFVANGKFPNNSKGQSDKASFVHGTAKLGATYKINGRHYINGYVGYISRAPFSRNSFQSPQTRNFLADNLTNEKIMSGELSYVVRHPRLSARLTGYYINSRDGARSNSFYFINVGRTVGAFVNTIYTEIDRINYGMELGVDYKVSQVFSLGFASSLGEFYYNSRPDLTITVDNSAQDVSADINRTSYLQNFNLSGYPQIANTFKVQYTSPNFWSASINANYMDDIFIDPNPVRRTYSLSSAVLNNTDVKGGENINPSDLTQQLVAQEKFNSIFTIDLFVRKSWRIGDYYLSAYANVSNLLDRKDLITGGFEQLRFDYADLDADRWASRYFYAYGRNYSFGFNLSL